MQDKVKLTCEDYIFELNFKTDYCFDIAIVDPITYKRYRNKNAQFSKIPKASILACLQNKKSKELKYKITEQFQEPLQQKGEQKLTLLKTQCLRFQITVSLEYIQSFSESIILYEEENYRQLNCHVPKKLSKQDVKQVKRKLSEIQSAIPTGEETPQEMFQCHEVANLSLVYDRAKEDKLAIGFIAYFVVVLLGWITYYSFPQFLGLVLLAVGILVIYFRSQKYLIKSIELKKGTYRINISGQLTVQNYSQNRTDSFVLHLEFNRWTSQKLKLYINSMNYYAYPFNGSLIVESKKEQEVQIKIQKNAKFYPVTLQNTIITVDKVSHFSSLS